METIISIIKYNPDKGLEISWKEDFKISTKSSSGEMLIVANKAGLVSLANHLLTLAQDEVPSNSHIHYDELNSLEEGSIEFVIQKM